MKKVFGILTILLTVSACKEPPVTNAPDPSDPKDPVACVADIQKAMDDYYALIQDNDPDNDPAEMPVECDLPQVNPGEELTYTAVLRDFSSTQEAKMRAALEKAKIVLNSQEFKDRVINHTYNGRRTFVANNGQTNEEIYETIMKGAEKLQPEIDHEMDLDITLYYQATSTVGYTYPNTNRIWVNSKFFNGYTHGQVAANAVHEWTHKLGYGHTSYYTSARPYSVPYGVGTIIRKLVDQLN
ncbi:MAG: hypothetical protein CME64_05485 [Halobacteriovoraceae bacterium]|nr:hypothetical protein [Halobacteriovoraceae bacterium]